MIRLAVALALLLAAPLSAQEIAVGSGDHRGFTRLTLPVPEGADWRLGRSAGGYALRINPPVDFRFDRVFRRVSRDRIADLSSVPGSGQLDISVTCDCHAEVLPWRDNWLVLDIRSGPPPAGSPWEQPLDQPSLQRQPPAAVMLPLIASEPLPPLPLPDPFTRRPDPRTATVLRDMAEAISAGSEQGLLDLAVRPSALGQFPRPPDQAAGPPTAALQSALADIPSMPERQATPGIVAMTSLERDRRGTATPVETSRTCLPDTDFDLAAWSGGGDFATEIASARLALTSETGSVPPGAREALARVYLAFGFGLEAEAALRSDAESSAERDRLVLLARIVDGRPVDDTALAGQAGCTGSVALWRALAADTIDDMPETERTAAVTAFRLLPSALRGQIAPRLAGLFARAGDALAAEEILASPDAAYPADLEAPAIAAAAIGMARAEPAMTLSALDDLARTEPEMSADTLLALVESGLLAGERPDEDRLELVRAMRFEYRDRPEDPALARAEVRLLSAMDRHEEALALAAGDAVASPPATLAEVVSAMVARTDDIRFLDIVLAGLPPGIPPDSINAVSARLIDLGFHAEAAVLVDSDAAGAAGLERRYLRAAAAAALDRPWTVETALAGLNDERASLIRVQAGLTAVAADASRQERNSAAWQSGDWAALEASEDPLLQSAAAAMTDQADLALDAPPLAAREALIAEAEAARQLARDLLDRYAASSGP